jgi:mannose-6-phosphate isomerase-like protein (cupin superfamily)
MGSSIIEKEIITDHRPWGYYSVLEEKDGYKVKKLVIKPHQRLSLQLHYHRDEQWIVAKGKAVLRCGENSREYTEGESATILRGQLHRIENTSDADTVIIEVQNGEYLGEDDIVRFEDDYSRVK